MDNVAGNNKFCGPSVMAAIAGISTDKAESVIQAVLKSNRAIRGVWYKDLVKAFNSLGFKTAEIPDVRGHTVYSSMFALNGRNGVYVFMVPGHYIAIEIQDSKRYICDNHTKEPINLASSARLGMKVMQAFRVER